MYRDPFRELEGLKKVTEVVNFFSVDEIRKDGDLLQQSHFSGSFHVVSYDTCKYQEIISLNPPTLLYL